MREIESGPAGAAESLGAPPGGSPERRQIYFYEWIWEYLMLRSSNGLAGLRNRRAKKRVENSL